MGNRMVDIWQFTGMSRVVCPKSRRLRDIKTSGRASNPAGKTGKGSGSLATATGSFPRCSPPFRRLPLGTPGLSPACHPSGRSTLETDSIPCTGWCEPACLSGTLDSPRFPESSLTPDLPSPLIRFPVQPTGSRHTPIATRMPMAGLLVFAGDSEGLTGWPRKRVVGLPTAIARCCNAWILRMQAPTGSGGEQASPDVVVGRSRGN